MVPEIMNGGATVNTDKTSVMKPGKELAGAVRAGFILRGTSLHAHCKEIGVDASYARKTLMGNYVGPSGAELIYKLIEASGAQQAAGQSNEQEVA